MKDSRRRQAIIYRRVFLEKSSFYCWMIKFRMRLSFVNLIISLFVSTDFHKLGSPIDQHMYEKRSFVMTLVNLRSLQNLRKLVAYKNYRKRGSASYIVRQWLLWESEREREREREREERDACDVIDITLKSRVIMHMITSTARIDPTRRRVLTLTLSSAQTSKCM